MYKFSIIFILFLLGLKCFSQTEELLTKQITEVKNAIENDNGAFADSMFIEIESRFTRDVLNNETEYLIAKAEFLSVFKDNYAESISFGLRAKNNLENTETPNLVSKAKVYSFLGNAYSRASEIEKSIEFREMALNIYTTIKDSVNMGKQLSNLSNIYRTDNQEEKSINYSLKSIEVFEKVGKHNY